MISDWIHISCHLSREKSFRQNIIVWWERFSRCVNVEGWTVIELWWTREYYHLNSFIPFWNIRFFIDNINKDNFNYSMFSSNQILLDINDVIIRSYFNCDYANRQAIGIHQEPRRTFLWIFGSVRFRSASSARGRILYCCH